MQTFLPYEDYQKSFACLDNKRLGNQVYREGKTLLDGKWANHPISKMWAGYRWELACYCHAGALEMARRKLWAKETCDRWRLYFLDKMESLPWTGKPPWLGDEELHASHRSNLLRKDKNHYGQFGWTESDNLPYKWI